MSKKTKNQFASMKEALATFDLKRVLEWLKKYNPSLYASFKKEKGEIQMATMCKMICNRTDMLGTDAHKKAVQWLANHDMKGRLF